MTIYKNIINLLLLLKSFLSFYSYLTILTFPSGTQNSEYRQRRRCLIRTITFSCSRGLYPSLSYQALFSFYPKNYILGLGDLYFKFFLSFFKMWWFPNLHLLAKKIKTTYSPQRRWKESKFFKCFGCQPLPFAFYIEIATTYTNYTQ